MSTPPNSHEKDSFPHRRRRPKSWTYATRLQEESARTGFDGLLNLPRPKRVTTTLLVLGAHSDGAVTPKEVRATARAYRTEAEFFPNIGHDMMLEPGWAAVAERIHTWLGTHGL